MPKILMKVKKIGSDVVWNEEYDNCPAEPYVWAKAIIDNFNATLREGEALRELVDVVVLNEDTVIEHEWEKTNLFTIVRGTKNYDTMQCKCCGVTGKRFGLSDVVTRDSKYKAKKYDKCNRK
ncbi:hypothetical protein M5X17_31115 [Paenibacillus alvei]|uniref:hypothetical protein n=1 Tax=Paenibacillus alvei TaxID=44250 RepID=UPI0022816D03|nr:hypothetical protein [Paenibacillus alvei]MCY9738144.1 hypothetical protein [Paenibacillus alvei]